MQTRMFTDTVLGAKQTGGVRTDGNPASARKESPVPTTGGWYALPGRFHTNVRDENVALNLLTLLPGLRTAAIGGVRVRDADRTTRRTGQTERTPRAS